MFRYLPSRPNISTPRAAKMKNNRKKSRPKFPTCGKACITVSSRALIPLAIFRSFSTNPPEERKIKTTEFVASSTYVGTGKEAKKTTTNNLFYRVDSRNQTNLIILQCLYYDHRIYVLLVLEGEYLFSGLAKKVTTSKKSTFFVLS